MRFTLVVYVFHKVNVLVTDIILNISSQEHLIFTYVFHKVNVLVTDIILNISSQEHLIFTSLHIGSRLFELFSKEVRVNKQPGRPLSTRIHARRLATTDIFTYCKNASGVAIFRVSSLCG